MIKYKNLELVKSLYAHLNVKITEIVDSYDDATLCRKILSKIYNWSSHDTQELNNLLKNTSHHSDVRNNKEYAFNIIINWLIEDLIYEILSVDYKVTKIGSDNNRKLLSGRNINSEPDLLISLKNNIMIEIIANYPIKDYSSFWEKEFYFDLRDNKMNSLLDRCKTNRVLIIGVVVEKKKIFIMEINFDTSFQQIKSESNFGHKKTSRIHFHDRKIELHPISTLNTIIRNI